MPGTPREFKADLSRFSIKVDLAIIGVIKETAKSVRLQVATRTPINTGRASASWNASVGTPNFSTKSRGYNSPGSAPTDGRVTLTGFLLGRTIHISNGISYIGKLNSGSSLKAPAGFVEASVATIPLQLPLIVRQVRARIQV